jgi:hypothetical protein
MKLIIAGSRTFRDHERMFKLLTKFDRHTTIGKILSGCQVSKDKDTDELYGADYYGKMWGEANGIRIEEYPADWNKYDKAAGPIRNGEMAKNAHILIAFWDGKSRGTKDMIDKAYKQKLEVHVYMH